MLSSAFYTTSIIDYFHVSIFPVTRFAIFQNLFHYMCIFQLEGRGNISTRQSPLVNNEKSSLVEKEKSCGRTSGLSEDKLQGLSTGGEGWEKKLKRKRSIGTVLNRGNDADRDVKSGGQHRPANEANPRPSDGPSHR